jgi:hypothetical protein
MQQAQRDAAVAAGVLRVGTPRPLALCLLPFAFVAFFGPTIGGDGENGGLVRACWRYLGYTEWRGDVIEWVHLRLVPRAAGGARPGGRAAGGVPAVSSAVRGDTPRAEVLQRERPGAFLAGRARRRELRFWLRCEHREP